MAFQRPVRERVSRLRLFKGVAGDPSQVLLRKTQEGDSSLSIANEVYDLSITEKGTLQLRDGCRKINSYNASIASLFFVYLGGVGQYGILSGGSIDLLDQPALLELEEWKELELPSDFPTTYKTKMKKPPLEDIPMDDPSVPPDEQACPVSYTWTRSPETISFVMPFGGPLPSSQGFYWELIGYKDTQTTGTFNADAAWLDSSFGNYWYTLLAPCVGRMVQQLQVQVADPALTYAPGDYSFTKTLSINDGTSLSCVVGLHVGAPSMLLAGDTTINWGDIAFGDDPSTTKTINISNDSTDAYVSTVLRWTATVTGALASYITLSATSGSETQGATATAITVTGDTSSLAIGSYTGTITFSGETGSGVVDQTVPITLAIVAGVPAACPYSTPVNLVATSRLSDASGPATFYGFGTTPPYTVYWQSSCYWVGPKAPTYAYVNNIYVGLATAEPSGTFKSLDATWTVINVPWATVLAGVTYPCWLIRLIGSYVSYGVTVGVGVKSTGSTPVGTYTSKYEAPLPPASGFTMSIGSITGTA